jgi:hypothetical protein
MMIKYTNHAAGIKMKVTENADEHCKLDSYYFI